MYIYPNSRLILLKDVPLDPSYEHTIYFRDADQQRIYFYSSGITGGTNKKFWLAEFNNQSYTRVRKGVIRVQKPAEDLYCCNYMMFQNNLYREGEGSASLRPGVTNGLKWFYAFVTSVEYINDNVTELTFELDVMQTWLFNYSLNYCFVEREHSETDEYFEHLIPENLDIGNSYVVNSSTNTQNCKRLNTEDPNDHNTYDTSDLSACILINRVNKIDDTDDPWESITYANVYTPVKVEVNTNINNPAQIDAQLDRYNENDIICVYEYSSIFGSPEHPNTKTYTIQIPFKETYPLDFTPKNKKLFSYPYMKIIVSNNSGGVAEYKWEDWNAASTSGYLPSLGSFIVHGTFLSRPTMIIYPHDYKRLSHAFHEGLVFDSYPQCAWAGDTYKAWWAQNKASYVTSILSSVFSAGIGLIGGVVGDTANAGSGISAGGGVLTSAMKSVAKLEDIRNAPSQTYGQTQCDTIIPGLDRVRFDIFNVCIKDEFARAIDDFFTRFGYACHKNKIPNRNVRKHWCYTKTAGCTLIGNNLPATAESKICNIYNKGITFWKPYIAEAQNNSSENMSDLSWYFDIGNYAYDNSPVSGGNNNA